MIRARLAAQVPKTVIVDKVNTSGGPEPYDILVLETDQEIDDAIKVLEEVKRQSIGQKMIYVFSEGGKLGVDAT